MAEAVRRVGGTLGDAVPFTEALVRLKERSGSYVQAQGAVRVAEETLFQTRIEMPANLVEGDYAAEFFLVRDHAVIYSGETLIRVEKTGIERWIYNRRCASRCSTASARCCWRWRRAGWRPRPSGWDGGDGVVRIRYHTSPLELPDAVALTSGVAVPNPASARDDSGGATAGGRVAAAGAVGRCPGSGPGGTAQPARFFLKRGREDLVLRTRRAGTIRPASGPHAAHLRLQVARRHRRAPRPARGGRRPGAGLERSRMWSGGSGCGRRRRAGRRAPPGRGRGSAAA